MPAGVLAVVLFSLGLLASIMIHEWGHFSTARFFGMRADRFFVGFGPTVWSVQRGETEYGVKALPLGGFVRIRGMGETDERRRPVQDELFDPETLAAERRTVADGTSVDVLDVPTVTQATWTRFDQLLDERGTPADLRVQLREQGELAVDPYATPAEARDALRGVLETHVEGVDAPEDSRETLRSLRHRLLRGDRGRFFQDRPPRERAVVLAAGSALHMVQAWVLLFFLLLLNGGGAFPTTTVDAIVEGSAADVAGLEVGDTILEIDGIAIQDFEQARDLIVARPEVETSFLIERDGVEQTLTATPTLATDPDTGEALGGRLGFVPGTDVEGLGPLEALREASVGESGIVALTGRTFGALGQVFGPDGVGKIFSAVGGEEDRGQEGGVSIVGAGRFAAQAADEVGVVTSVIGLLASINIFIGIFNILPFPPLDGGHLAVLGVETAVNGVRKRRGRAADFRVDQRTVAAIAIPVIAVIGTVSIALLWLDIVNPVSLN